MREDWETKRWGEVLEIRSGRNQKEVLNPNGKYPIMGSAGKIMGYADSYICEAGTTIIGRKGTINNPLFIEERFWNVDTAFGLHTLENLDKNFLHYFCLSFDFTQLDKGSGRPSLVKSDLLKIKIPIPPLPEQQQIVILLDEAFEAIDQAKANIEKNIENAKELLQSKINEVFSQKGEGWEERILGEVVNVIGGGTPSKKVEKYYNGDIPWATVRDMNLDKLSITDHKITKLGLKESSANIIPKEHIIIATRVGLGKVCILEQDTAINQDLKGLIPKSKYDILNDFIFWWYKSIAYKVVGAGTGATVQGVKLPFVKSLTFPLTSKEEQVRVVNVLNKFSMDVENLELKYSQKLVVLEELKKSILQKAFAGELTNKTVEI